MSSMRLNLDSRLRLVTSRQSKFEKSRDDAPACNNSITCMSVNKAFSDIRSRRELIFHQPLPFLLSSPPPPPHHLPSPILAPSLPFTAKMAKTATGSLNSVLPRKILLFLAISHYRSRSLITHSNSNNHESRHQERQLEDD